MAWRRASQRIDRLGCAPAAGAARLRYPPRGSDRASRVRAHARAGDRAFDVERVARLANRAGVSVAERVFDSGSWLARILIPAREDTGVLVDQALSEKARTIPVRRSSIWGPDPGSSPSRWRRCPNAGSHCRRCRIAAALAVTQDERRTPWRVVRFLAWRLVCHRSEKNVSI